MADISAIVNEWATKLTDSELAAQLRATIDAGDEAELADAFRCELEFGTAGLRGILGVGPNRMNVLTVGKATQGLADYLNANFENPTVAIARDSRNKGDVFVQVAAGVLAANGVRSFLYPRIEPVPALSFAVRDLHATAGICMTASHNPAQYNGYKVYGSDGCQITTQASRDIQAAINAVDFFDGIKAVSFEEALASGMANYIGEEVLDRFIDAVAAQSLEGETAPSENPLSVVYTPLNGSGKECVLRILERVGVTDVTVVPEQAEPDGNFPTCPYPNPEIRAAMERGIALAEEVKPDLLLATDPDADRVGIAVPHNGEYCLLTGNEVGILLLDYVATKRAARGENMARAVAVTTIVSSAMIDELAREYGFELRRTLTGFKYIGEQIALLEAENEGDRYIFGFEESYGYLSGTHVRDKDGVNASMLICQMAQHWKAQGKNLVEAMEALYEKHGYCLNRTISLEYPGAEGAERMKAIMARLREETPEAIAEQQVLAATDYAAGAAMPLVNGPAPEHVCDGGVCRMVYPEAQQLPAANVLEYKLASGNKVIVRPSGTEPKIKVYFFVSAPTRTAANAELDTLEAAMRELMA